MNERMAWGVGLAWRDADGSALDFWCPSPRLGTPPALAAPPRPDQPAAPSRPDRPDRPDTAGTPSDPAAAWPGEAELAPLVGEDRERGLVRALARVSLDLDQAPAGVEDAYLRLHLLSHRLVAPGQVNLTGLFGILPNVVWTSAGPCRPEGFEQTRLRLEAAGRGPVRVHGIDKFPAMTDYALPTGVRVADSARVRLGAHLAPGTTVMHEGFVNFNAGTLGESMVEGRISQGVVVSPGADIGGGASIMGTLSGGGQTRISVGPRSLIGANAGIGISLGADCVVEAGLYLTAGAKVTVLGAATSPPADAVASSRADRPGRVVKAAELSGQDGWLFRRNSQTGAIEAVPRLGGAGVELNAELHAN
ncbi:MAG: 2,3,4,5-tetrahydropyridine-2,6-dicarboxylate N-succinyltransferase [Bifidobacteriaceae bacterium]|jgi:2,3,4,5-tetrahydropyridine-2-carboxylate N-succinyltransferase|nr:2,3,4,5-tetrahydropyridine-2,6-dicarboxylate N-succinyltransferase [Bifidobacteriaceae bacterium]